MGFAIDLWQNPWDTLIRPRHAVQWEGLLEERLVNDERLGKKVMKNLLEREERQDMMERLGPMPSRASKRGW